MFISPEKFYVCGIAGTVAAAIFGGWDGAVITLLTFMGLDYLSGVILAGIFKKSPKTATGALDSKVGARGFFRKGGMLCIVYIAVRLDILCGLNGVLRTGVICALIVNETISITENLGTMGVPLPKVLRDAIEQLREQTNERVQSDGIERLEDDTEEPREENR